jgi:hypothetical protein
VSRETLRRLEKATPRLRVLGLERDVDRLATDDELARKRQDLELQGSRHDAALPGLTELVPNKAAFSL